jgi:gamma-glutamyltranspeptidase/glutathione hydrolase
VNFESRIAKSTRDSLAAMGHQIVMRGDYSSTRMGAGQAVQRHFVTKVNSGASDPRKDGAAIAEMIVATPVRR